MQLLSRLNQENYQFLSFSFWILNFLSAIISFLYSCSIYLSSTSTFITFLFTWLNKWIKRLKCVEIKPVASFLMILIKIIFLIHLNFIFTLELFTLAHKDPNNVFLTNFNHHTYPTIIFPWKSRKEYFLSDASFHF